MTALFVLVLIAAMLVPVAYLAIRSFQHSAHSPRSQTSWFILALAASAPFLLFLLFLNAGPRDAELMFTVAMLAGAMLLLVMWIRELITLMGMGDEAFPGRYDKLLWFALLLLVPPIGVVTFALFRRVYWTANKPATVPTHDLI